MEGYPSVDIKWLCHKMSQALAGFVQAVPPGQGPGLPLLHLQMLAIVTSQAASDRATRAARERVMARIFQLSVSEDVYWFVCCWGLCCNTMQYQYTGMGQCKCPQGGNRLLMDKKRLRHRKRERESDAFAILQLLSYHVSLCLFCSVKAQLNEAHAVLSCPTQTFGAPSCPQLLPIETGLLGNSEPKTHCKLQTLLRIVERWEASQGVIAGTWGCVRSRACAFLPVVLPWLHRLGLRQNPGAGRRQGPLGRNHSMRSSRIRIIRWIQDKRKEAANNEGANTKRKVKRLDYCSESCWTKPWRSSMWQILLHTCSWALSQDAELDLTRAVPNSA